MPMLITYTNPTMRPDLVEGESWSRLDAESPRLGTINLKSLDDGHRIIVNKSAVAKVEEYTKEAWAAILQKQKDDLDATIAAAKNKSEDEQAAKDREIRRALAALEARKFKNRIKRLFGRKP